MNKTYEFMYIINVNADIEKVINDLSSVITDKNGTIRQTERWGSKKLAYKIQDMDYGYYVLVTFSCSVQTVKKLDEAARNHKYVLRHMISPKGDL